jgi:periplasmic protein TonB
MRLTASLLAAAAFHGLLFGVVAAVLPRQTAPHLAPAAVEVDVIAPRPDPIADSAATTAEAPTKRPASPRPHHREVARVSDSTPGESTVVSDAPSPVSSAIASTAGPGGPPAHARTPEASGGSGIVSASPRYRANPKPDYPLPCKRRREEGMVLLNVVVQANGLPAALSLNRSSGHPLLDRAALDAVRRWTFEPGRAAGVPVSSLVVVPVRFSLSEQP